MTAGARTMCDLVRDPAGTAIRLSEQPGRTGVLEALGWSATEATSVLDAVLAPLPEASGEGHVRERVKIVAGRDQFWSVVPVGGGARPWLHRMPHGPLCLQHPNDDRRVLWLWEDGLEALILKTRFHLACEESWRRTGRWPGPDLPHGEPWRGRRVPPLPAEMQAAVEKRWAR